MYEFREEKKRLKKVFLFLLFFVFSMADTFFLFINNVEYKAEKKKMK